MMMKKALMLAPLLAMITANAGCTAGASAASTPQRIRDGAATAGLGGHARFGGLDVIPLRVEEDSRCPASVQCIWAGTVRLAVRIDDRGRHSESVLSLDRPVELAGGLLTLKVVCPHRAHPGRVARGSYLFTFIFSLPDRPPPVVPACVR